MKTKQKTEDMSVDELLESVEAETPWTQDDAILMCKMVESIAPKYGCHVALTGGTLYKKGPRKDCDILFYRIRQIKQIDIEGLFLALGLIGFETFIGRGWCYKTKFNGLPVDCFFPESVGDENYYTNRGLR